MKIFKVTFHYELDIIADNEQNAIESFAEKIDGITIIDCANAEEIK